MVLARGLIRELQLDDCLLGPDGMWAPFSLGHSDRLLSLFSAAGIADASLRTLNGTARFPSIEAWVHTDIKGWTLADMIDDTEYEALQQAAQAELADFAQEDGRVRFAAPAHVVTARKP